MSRRKAIRAPTSTNIDQFYVRSANGSQVPLCSLVHVRQITGPEFILRFNEYNAAQTQHYAARPAYSSGQVRAALEDASADDAAGHGLRLSGMSYQEQRAAEGVPGMGGLRASRCSLSF